MDSSRRPVGRVRPPGATLRLTVFSGAERVAVVVSASERLDDVLDVLLPTPVVAVVSSAGDRVPSDRTMADAGVQDGSVLVALHADMTDLHPPGSEGAGGSPPPRARTVPRPVVVAIGPVALVVATGALGADVLRRLWLGATSAPPLLSSVVVALAYLGCRLAPELAVRLTMRGGDAPRRERSAAALVREVAARRLAARSLMLPLVVVTSALSGLGPRSPGLPTNVLLGCAATGFALLSRSCSQRAEAGLLRACSVLTGLGLVASWVGHQPDVVGIAVGLGLVVVGCALVADWPRAPAKRRPRLARAADRVESTVTVAILPLALWAGGAMSLIARTRA